MSAAPPFGCDTKAAARLGLLRQPRAGVVWKFGKKAVVGEDKEVPIAGPVTLNESNLEVNILSEELESCQITKEKPVSPVKGEKDNGKENVNYPNEEEDEFSDKPGEKLMMPPPEPKGLNKRKGESAPRDSCQPEGEQSKMSPAMAFFTAEQIPEESNMNAFNADALLEKGAMGGRREGDNEYDNHFRAAGPQPPKPVPRSFTKFYFEEYNKLGEEEPLKQELEATMDNVGLEWDEIAEDPSRTLAWNVFVDTWDWVKYGTHDNDE